MQLGYNVFRCKIAATSWIPGKQVVTYFIIIGGSKGYPVDNISDDKGQKHKTTQAKKWTDDSSGVYSNQYANRTWTKFRLENSLRSEYCGVRQTPGSNENQTKQNEALVIPWIQMNVKDSKV